MITTGILRIATVIGLIILAVGTYFGVASYVRSKIERYF